jgi:hypothetical protein
MLEEPPVSTVAPTEFPIDLPEDEEPLFMDPDANPASEQPVPDRRPDLSKPSDEVAKLVLNISQAAWRYYGQYNQSVDYVTQNGLLYEYPSSTYVTPAHLEGIEGFDMAYAEEAASILFIKSADMEPYLAADTDEWGVYASYETTGGYVVGGFGKTALVPKEGYEEMMKAYDCSRPASRVSSKSPEYAEALKAIEEGSSAKGPYDVRYMETDGKYVSAVVSSKDSPLYIREYILQVQGTTYIIRADKLESMESKIVAVNREIPDLSLAIVPPYELLTNRRYLITDFTNFTQSLKTSGMTTDEDGEPSFISGNDEFVFMVFPSGLHLLCNSTEAGEWKVYPVLTYDEAVSRMKELSKFNPPPYFLIKQS